MKNFETWHARFYITVHAIISGLFCNFISVLIHIGLSSFFFFLRFILFVRKGYKIQKMVFKQMT